MHLSLVLAHVPTAVALFCGAVGRLATFQMARADRGVLAYRWIELGVLVVVLTLTLAPAASAGVVTKPF